jgi:hypothetical protein
VGTPSHRFSCLTLFSTIPIRAMCQWSMIQCVARPRYWHRDMLGLFGPHFSPLKCCLARRYVYETVVQFYHNHHPASSRCSTWLALFSWSFFVALLPLPWEAPIVVVLDGTFFDPKGGGESQVMAHRRRRAPERKMFLSVPVYIMSDESTRSSSPPTVLRMCLRDQAKVW